MMQSMLEDRFKLATHREQRQMPVEVLILARSDGRLGPNVQSIDECTAEKIAKVRQLLPPRPKRTPRGTTSSGCTVGFGDLATGLTQILATPVIDGTGLTGRHFFEVHAEAPRNQAGAQSEADPGFPPWRMALEEQLGLKLESRRGPMEVLVVDSVQQPTEN